MTQTLDDTHLHLLGLFDLDVATGIAVHLLKELVELLVQHNHLHLLFGSSVSMTNDPYHTPQLIPISQIGQALSP